MKRFFIVTTILMLFSFASPMLAQEEVFIKQYLERFENSREYLLLVAETMPEDKYGFKATPESMTFAENLMHIGWAMDWHSESLMGGRDARDWNTDTSQLDDELDYFGLKRTKRQVLLLLADHITHHRGQMLVYMRLNGLKPPRYVLFQ
ncbi:MAG: DinB family protein [Lutimonas sp.]|jgi:hypothetical protein